MKTKEWKILENESDGLVLTHGSIYLYFDSIGSDGECWYIYRDGRLIAELGSYQNKIINYDDFADRIRSMEVRGYGANNGDHVSLGKDI